MNLSQSGPAILAIRLGAMGDVIHALPAVRALGSIHPQARIWWLIEPKWMPLLEENSFLTGTLAMDRSGLRPLIDSMTRLRSRRFDILVDFQGLLKSAIPCGLAHARSRFGFDAGFSKEPSSALFYDHRVRPSSRHIVEQYMDLAVAAGAERREFVFDLPSGRPEGSLPVEPYVLASPLAGWPSKQWPLERYTELARLVEDRLHCKLVINGSPKDSAKLQSIQGVHLHLSSIAGLIHATRGAKAVVGLDSGPMHLAAALGLPGVALFGPTDPERNGPYGNSFTVLRNPRAVTSYKHREGTDDSLLDITPEQVVEALEAAI